MRFSALWVVALAGCVAPDGISPIDDTDTADTGADTGSLDSGDSEVDTADTTDTGVSEVPDDLPVEDPEKGVNDALDPNDTSESGVAGLRAQASGRRLWKRVFADEFEGPTPDDDPTCFTRAPRCVEHVSWGVRDCPAGYEEPLADLNKCTWSVYHFWNYMNGKDADRLVNSFDPSEVRVDGGALHLTAHGWGEDGHDCGRLYDDPRFPGDPNRTIDCPFTSGGVHSRPEGIPGFEQLRGRFEIRARLSHGPGTWPAIWTLPTSGGWPDDGEIDIMEHWIDDDRRVAANYHDGIGAQDVHVADGQPWRAKDRYYPQDGYKDTFFEDWHVYAVEWDEQELRFYVDKWIIGVISDGVTWEDDGVDHVVRLPVIPNYVLLNLTIAPKLGTWLQDLFGDNRPDADDFEPQSFDIDYVRVYAACDESEACPDGGAYDGVHCDHGQAPAGAFVDALGRVATVIPTGDCPQDAVRDGVVCVFPSVPPEARPWMWQGHVYTKAGCMETTLSTTCTDPCQGVGVPDGYGCFVGTAPNDLIADLDDDETAFWYRRSLIGGIFSDPECAPDDPLIDGWCRWDDVPAGRDPFVMNDDDVGRFYVHPWCEVEETVANCPEPCPSGGWFDGAGCVVGEAPQGTNAFVYANQMYYGALSTDPALACTHGGSWDGANCHLGAPPAGTTVAAQGERFVVPAACGRVPWWNERGL